MVDIIGASGCLELRQETPTMEAGALQATLHSLTSDYVKRLNLQVMTVHPGHVTLKLPLCPELVHAGGVLCGQAIMSAIDTGMLVAMIARIGEFRPMTTVQLQTSFLRPVLRDTSHVVIVARVLRFGKSLSYGDVELSTPDGKLAAHGTTTYALL
jgi:uncharacterized protein (TIGR00369 family)